MMTVGANQPYRIDSRQVYLEARPLIRRLWVSIDNQFTEAGGQSLLASYLAMNPGIFELHVNIVMGDTLETLPKLERMILLTRQFRIGVEKSVPTICIYVPYDQINKGLADLIAELDVYNPPISLFPIIRDSDVSSDDNLLQRTAVVSHDLFERVISFRYLLLLQADVGMMKRMVNLVSRLVLQQRRLRVDVPTYPPIFEINPRIEVAGWGTVTRSLLALYLQYPELVEFVTAGTCGLSCLFFRAKEAYALEYQLGLGSLPIPIVPCGAGILAGLAESRQINSSRSHSCFYALQNSFIEAIAKCTHCPLVRYCLGCPIAATSKDECHAYSFVNSLLIEFSKNPCLFEQLGMPKPKIGVLELDWDYIYDSLEDISFRRNNLG